MRKLLPGRKVILRISLSLSPPLGKNEPQKCDACEEEAFQRGKVKKRSPDKLGLRGFSEGHLSVRASLDISVALSAELFFL